MSDYPVLDELRLKFVGVGSRVRVIRLGPDWYDKWQAEMDRYEEELPAELRFVYTDGRPRFKGALVERQDTDGVTFES